MSKQNINLISHSVYRKEKAEKTTFPLGVSNIVVNGEVWTTFHYFDEYSMFWWRNRKKSWNIKILDAFQTDFVSSAAQNSRNYTKNTHKNEESITANIEEPKSTVQVEKAKEDVCFWAEASLKQTSVQNSNTNINKERDRIVRNRTNKPMDLGYLIGFSHRLKSWCNKRVRGSGELSTLRDINRERLPKKHRLRKWLNQEDPETAQARHREKAQVNIRIAAAEAAMVFAMRARSKKAARAGAFATAAFARVVAEETGSYASHGSIAEVISGACKDVAKSSLVRRAKNGDYRKLHGLFHYHYKFRGPDYYKPLEPCCHHTRRLDGKPTIYCKMNEPDETFRSSAITKNSPLVQFLQQLTEEGVIKRQGKNPDKLRSEPSIKSFKTDTFVKSNDKVSMIDSTGGTPLEAISSKTPLEMCSTTTGEANIPQGSDSGLDVIFRKSHKDSLSGVSLQSMFLTTTTRKHKGDEPDQMNGLTPVKYFLGLFDPYSTLDEDVNPDTEEVETLPRMVSETIWQDKPLKPASQFRFGSHYLSMRTSSIEVTG